MIYDFTVCGPKRIASGIGALQALPSALDALGAKRVLLITGRTLARSTDLVGNVEAVLGPRHAATFADCAQHVPDSSVDAGYEAMRACEADALVVFGGGSPIDTSKMLVHRLMNEGGQPVPQVAIPTTLSAGEFTHAAGMTNEQTRVKHVYVDAALQPEVIIFDPELARPTPSDLWVTTGVKSLDHAVEGLWWPNCHPFLASLREGAIADLQDNLARSQDPNELEARLACQHAAWKSISGLLSAKDVGFRLSHPLGHQIGARWDVPHGVTSCVALPAAARFLHERTGPAQRRIARALGVDSSQGAAEAIERFLDTLEVPRRLSETSAVRADIPSVAKAVADELSHLSAPDQDIATPAALTALLESIW